MIGLIKLLLFSIVFQKVTSDSCVTYNFEDRFDELFNSEYRMCTTMGAGGIWVQGNYSDTPIESPHAASTSFISPSSVMSCTSSFTFPMSNGGSFELHVYMESEAMTDQLLLFLNEIVEGGNDVQVGTYPLTPALPHYQVGWNELSITLGGTGTFEGYVTLMAQASEESILLVDAFRYIPANGDVDSCVIYENEEETDSNETDENNSNQTDEDDSNKTDEDDTNITDENNSTETEENEPNITDENISTETDEDDSNKTEEDDTNITYENNSTETEENEPNETDEEENVTNEIDEEDLNNTDETETEENNSNETDEPNDDPSPIINSNNFWNAITITMVVILSLITLALLSLCFYEFGKRRAQDKLPLIYNDFDVATAPTVTVPRVTKLYPDANIVSFN